MKRESYLLPSELVQEILETLGNNMFSSRDAGDGYQEDYNNDDVIDARNQLQSLVAKQDEAK